MKVKLIRHTCEPEMLAGYSAAKCYNGKDPCKSLEVAMDGGYECGNSTCITHLTSDALALIQKLQAENDRLTDEVCNAYNIQNEQLARIKQFEATVSEKEKVIAELSGKIGRLEAKRKQLLEKIELLDATSEE